MDARRIIVEAIKEYKKSTIALEALEALFAGIEVNQHEFAAAILELEHSSILQAVKASGRTMGRPSLAFKYRIHTEGMKQSIRQRLQQLQLRLHPTIQLDAYYSKPAQVLDEELPWIEKLDAYLKRNGFPEEAVPAPERSYELVGDEKWITDQGGHGLLQRLGVWERLKIDPVSDPLMLAVNPNGLRLINNTYDSAKHTLEKRPPCLHLIVENKTTFQALLPILQETGFHTLIYGCGNKITGNISMLPLQYPISNREHQIYYFGDLDHEGIRIWYEASKQLEVRPAVAFYEACLAKPFAVGKQNQRRNEAAVQAFLAHFSVEQQDKLTACLNAGGYYPQESLNTGELQRLWRSVSSTSDGSI
jgi:hypothetical protein